MSAEVGSHDTSIKLIHVACGRSSMDDGRGAFEVGERKFLSVRATAIRRPVRLHLEWYY